MGGGDALAVFLAGKNAEKPRTSQSSQAQDLAISPFCPHSPVGPIFFGGHHGHMAIASIAGCGVEGLQVPFRDALKSAVRGLGKCMFLCRRATWRRKLNACSERTMEGHGFAYVIDFHQIPAVRLTLSHVIFDEFDICGLLKHSLEVPHLQNHSVS